MLRKGVSLRGLEAFEALAATGSVAGAAELTKMSQPAVSQQLKNLESALGARLIEHDRRPMRLTPAGETFRIRAEAALAQLRRGQTELLGMNLAHLSALSIGLIDDFDHELTPRLATILAESLTDSRFKLITAASHDLVADMKERRLHMAVSSSAEEPLGGVLEIPLARDPFVLVAPRGAMPSRPRSLAAIEGLPFLRYDRDQLIGRLIERHLSRAGIDLPDRFEIGSNLALMAMVARGIGWAVTTPMGYMRAARYHDEIAVHPLPGPALARTIVLYAGSDWARDVPQDFARTVRQLLQEQMIDLAVARHPWLTGEFRLLDP